VRLDVAYLVLETLKVQLSFLVKHKNIIKIFIIWTYCSERRKRLTWYIMGFKGGIRKEGWNSYILMFIYFTDG
jgi:hypothetical protein